MSTAPDHFSEALCFELFLTISPLSTIAVIYNYTALTQNRFGAKFLTIF